MAVMNKSFISMAWRSLVVQVRLY